MAVEIRKICYGRYKVLSLKPEKYNDLYEKFTSQGKKLNSLLAWGTRLRHQKLLEAQPVGLVIADKFADESLIENRLKKLGRTVKLIQVPKAEQKHRRRRSVLARVSLLKWSNITKKTIRHPPTLFSVKTKPKIQKCFLLLEKIKIGFENRKM